MSLTKNRHLINVFALTTSAYSMSVLGYFLNIGDYFLLLHMAVLLTADSRNTVNSNFILNEDQFTVAVNGEKY